MPMRAVRLLTFAMSVPIVSGAAASQPFFPPETPARPVVDVLHGTTLTDRFRWLENGKDPEVEAWTRAQHAATLGFLDRNAKPVPGMREELARYFDRDRTDPPLFKHGRQFFQRTHRGEPQAKLYTKIDGRDVLIFDPIALDPSGKTRIGAVIPNRDATRLAVGVYAQGTERKDFRVIDSTTGAQIGPVIAGLPELVETTTVRGLNIHPIAADGLAALVSTPAFAHFTGLAIYPHNRADPYEVENEAYYRVVTTAPELSQVRHLALYGGVGRAAAALLARAKNLKSVRRLTIQGLVAPPAEVARLVGTPWFRRLRHFRSHLGEEAVARPVRGL